MVPTEGMHGPSARVDADVLDWLKSEGKGYQSRMNAILRRQMPASLRRGSGILPLPALTKNLCFLRQIFVYSS